VQTELITSGIAELRGKTTAERARAMISIAHPDFRDQLEDDAERPYTLK
jgi:acyl-CoA hydrolase